MQQPQEERMEHIARECEIRRHQYSRDGHCANYPIKVVDPVLLLGRPDGVGAHLVIRK